MKVLEGELSVGVRQKQCVAGLLVYKYGHWKVFTGEKGWVENNGLTYVISEDLQGREAEN